MKNKDKNDSYIALLEFGESHILCGISYAEIKAYLYKEGYFGNKNEGLLKTLIIQCFCLYDSGNSIIDGFEFFEHDDNTKLCLKLDSYYTFLEYVELNEARQSSKVARRWSLIAMVISIATLLASIYFSNKQLNSPTIIEATQFNQIKAILDKDLKRY